MKFSSLLKAVPWATILVFLVSLDGTFSKPLFNMLVKVAIVVVGFLAKISPQTAVVMSPPKDRMTD